MTGSGARAVSMSAATPWHPDVSDRFHRPQITPRQPWHRPDCASRRGPRMRSTVLYVAQLCATHPTALPCWAERSTARCSF